MPSFDPNQTQRHDPHATVRHQPVPAAAEVVAEPPPPPRPSNKGRRRHTVGCIVRMAAIASAVAVSLALVGLLLYRVAPPPRMNILIMGLDSRAGEGSATRTDTLMLLTIDPAQPYVGLLSIPRDLYVDIPGYGFQRINAANVLGESRGEGGGRQLAAQTVANTFNVTVHRTMRLDFEAFVAVIDAAGGVMVDVPESFIDYSYPTPDYGTMVVEFTAGRQTMDGERALQYARIRHGSSDFDRAERQQQIMEALVRRLINPLNWPRIPAVMLAVTQNVETDLTVFDMMLLGPAVLLNGPANIDQEVLGREYVTGAVTEAGASVQRPNWPAIDGLVEEMFRK